MAAITGLSLLGYDATSLSLFGEFFPFFSADPLQLWMASVTTQLFSGLSRDVRSGSSLALAGSLKDIQRLVPKPVLHCLGCVLRVIVLLEGEPSPPV